MRAIMFSALLAFSSQSAFAGDAYIPKTEVRPIYASCYRGPMVEVIWDRPQGTFVQDLVDYGYDHANANAIATMICTDQNLVGNPERLKATLLKEMAKNPPARQRYR